ncbi:hypothetical protein TNCT_9131 [Trichonephila clavata]|uniref:Uncharacterized protein n=1 Tax=Trichonephila clavata TaxID=2740835 RepID=A0A8X6L0H0_TRICU|nr:hypothetical protein TNCT_9131 [Trichonephila clavata]
MVNLSFTASFLNRIVLTRTLHMCSKYEHNSRVNPARAIILDGLRASTRKLASQLDISRNTPVKIMRKEIVICPYKIQILQFILDTFIAQQRDFTNMTLDFIYLRPQKPNGIEFMIGDVLFESHIRDLITHKIDSAKGLINIKLSGLIC